MEQEVHRLAACGRRRPRRRDNLGPIYDAEREKIYFKSFNRDPFGRLFNGSGRAISIIDLKSGDNGSEDESVATRNPDEQDVAPESDPEPEADESGDEKDNSRAPTTVDDARTKARWVYDGGAEIPRDCFGLVLMQDQYYVICRSGLYRLNLGEDGHDRSQ